MSLEKKLFSFLVLFGISMSTISIIIDLKVGLPTSVNSIWVILVIVFLLAYIIDRRYEYSKIGVRIVGIFSVFVLLPYSFVKFGGSSTTLGYVFLMVVSICYLFNGKEKKFFMSTLLSICTALILTEHFYPEISEVPSKEIILASRTVQFLSSAIAIYLIIVAFSTRYEKRLESTKIHNDELTLKNDMLVEENIELEKAVKEFYELSIRDKNTKIFNRVKLDESISCEIARSRRSREPFSLIMFDIDLFKVINDTYGHTVGDLILIELSELVNSHVREIDTFGRWGGEEFLIILPSTKIFSAIQIAERLRILIENKLFPKDIKITCSFGVTEYRIGDTEFEIVERVDKALYKAKNNGKNKVDIN